MKARTVIQVLIFAMILAVAIIPSSSIVKAESADKNSAYIVNASGIEEEDGFIASYYRSNKTVRISFDVLKTIEKGSFGVILAKSSDDIEYYQTAANYFAFSANGEMVATNGAVSSNDVVWEKGKNYCFDINGKEVIIKNRGYYQTEYKDIAKITFTTEMKGVVGICAFSDGIYAANCIIDNLKYYDADGEEVLRNRFNYSNIGDKGTLRVYSTHGSYAEKFDTVMFNVSFVDEAGNLLSQQKVCQYNYAEAPEAPYKKGYHFVRWSGDTTEINYDTTFYTIYEEGEEKKGCGGAISVELSIAGIAIATMCLRRKIR